MSGSRKEGRRKNLRAFRPTLDGALETRIVLSKLPGAVYLNHPKAIGVAYAHKQPPFLSAGAPRFPLSTIPRGRAVATETAHGGQTVIVGTPDGSHFRISLTQFIPPAGEGQTQTSTNSNIPGSQNPIQGQIPGGGAVQPIGTVRAYPMPGGRVGIIVDGSTTQTELDISPQPFPQRKGYAHSFAYGQSAQSHILNIGQISINSGTISAILGYHTADLSGPLDITGTNPVDRIAFQDILPGASIQTGGDLNTLDVLNGVNLNSGPGIVVGRDLNLFNVGQNLNLSGGASLLVGRFIGANPQPPKGTATGSNLLALNQALVGTGTATSVPALGAYIQGDVNVGANSQILVNGGLAQSVLVPNPAGGNSFESATFLVNGFVSVSGPSITGQVVSPAGNPFLFGTQIGQIPALNPIPSNPKLPANFVARSGYDTNETFP